MARRLSSGTGHRPLRSVQHDRSEVHPLSVVILPGKCLVRRSSVSVVLRQAYASSSPHTLGRIHAQYASHIAHVSRGSVQLRCEAVAARCWPGSRAAFCLASVTTSRRLQIARR
jgi:hypothetical protein